MEEDEPSYPVFPGVGCLKRSLFQVWPVGPGRTRPVRPGTGLVTISRLAALETRRLTGEKRPEFSFRR
jgi:hypothetical protein